MRGRLADKVALITGGASGIGRACAVRFAQEGARVCVADRDLAAATDTARKIDDDGRRAIAVAVDTTDEAANDAMVRRCVEALGGVDILVAAAGGGSLINLASIMSRMPSSGAAYSVSKAGVWMLTKCLARELAPHGIRVNAIGPGFIETPMTAPLRGDAARSDWAMKLTPMGRYGTPEEVAATALFLASDDASFFTGELLHPSGGVFVG